MPIYEYSCRRCDNSFEEVVLSERQTISCPKCASGDVERQLSVFASPGVRTEGAPAGGGCGCTPRGCGCR